MSLSNGAQGDNTRRKAQEKGASIQCHSERSEESLRYAQGDRLIEDWRLKIEI